MNNSVHHGVKERNKKHGFLEGTECYGREETTFEMEDGYIIHGDISINDPKKFVDHPELKKDFAMKIKDSKYKNLFFFMLKSCTKTFNEMVDYQISKSVDVFDKLWENYISKM